jgi:hypothetical protein
MLGACAPVVGGGVLVGVIGIGALTSHCYDYLDVTVFDAQGRKTCAATVTASNGGDHFELGSCYYAPLTDGVWTLRAALPGSLDAVSTVPVEHANDCTRHVQSVELTLNTPNSTPLPAPVMTTPAALPPPPAPPAELTPPVAPASEQSPAPSGAAVAPPPSVGVFPDQK